MLSMFSDLDRGIVTDGSDSDDLDDLESLYEGHAQSIFSSLDESIGKIDDFLAFDRSFMHGDIICSITDPSGQMGRVVDVDMLVDLENEFGHVIRDVDTKSLCRISYFCIGDYVIKGSWVGVVSRVIYHLVVTFDDGAVCLVENPNPQMLVPVASGFLEDSEYLYHPGQHVKCRLPSVLKNSRWLSGTWNATRHDAVVQKVEVQSVYVNWLATVLIGVDSDLHIPQCMQAPEELTILLPFPHANWQLGDCCKLLNHHGQANSGPSFHQGVQEMINLQGGQGNMQLNSDMSSDDIFAIVRKCIKANVLWQDGTLSIGLDSQVLCPVDKIGDHDFWPDEFVLFKCSDEDGQESVGKQVGVVRSVDAKERTAQVCWITEVSKTAQAKRGICEETVSVYELVEHPDYSFCFSDIVFQLPNQSWQDDMSLSTIADYGKGLNMKQQRPDEGYQKPLQSFLSCIGYVSGFKDARIEVAWADGHISKVSPYEIVRIDRNVEAVSAPLFFNENPEIIDREDIHACDRRSSRKQEKQDEFEKVPVCYGNMEFWKDSWQTNAVSIRQAAMGFLSNITSSLFCSQGSTSGGNFTPPGIIKPSVQHGIEFFNKTRPEKVQDGKEQIQILDDSHVSDHLNPEEGPVKVKVVSYIQSSKTSKAFGNFDIVEDHLDHHFVNELNSDLPQTRAWLKRIRQEWSILEKNLPDSIFVRVYEERADLLRAAISGAAGTPYHDGLFFFDIFFPPDYPQKPPLVHYISGGLRLNPNLYENGHVCLSLLNTWTGSGSEVWNPATSTILQVLVSLQALVLNAKPYFNEAGYDKQIGKADGEKNSIAYNENAFLLSCKSMLYHMRKPPKHFEDLVKEHFKHRAGSIIGACKAYMEGVQVGCLSVGGLGNNSSAGFRILLAKLFPRLVAAFTQLGIDCCQFVDGG